MNAPAHAARVLYFAALRDAAGVAAEPVDAAGTLGQLYDRLADRHGFGWSRAQVRVAVGDEFAHWDDPVRAGTDIAFVPPVSGG